MPAISVDEMREVDRVAVEETGPSLLQMMEHAGFETAQTAIEMLGQDWAGRRVVVLAGSGGNGGGGLSAARHLAIRGVTVLAVLTRPTTGVDGAVAAQLRTLQEAPAQVIHWSDAFDGQPFIDNAFVEFLNRDRHTTQELARLVRCRHGDQRLAERLNGIRRIDRQG